MASIYGSECGNETSYPVYCKKCYWGTCNSCKQNLASEASAANVTFFAAPTARMGGVRSLNSRATNRRPPVAGIGAGA